MMHIDYNPADVNDAASYIALVCIVPMLIAATAYGVGSTWYGSWLGRIFFGLFASIALIFGVILARRFFGDYPGYEWVAVAAYSLLFLTFSATAAVVIIESRGPDFALTTKGKRIMSTNTPGVPDHAAGASSPEQASFLDRSRKALAGGVTGAVTAGGTALTTALVDGSISGGDGWLLLGAVLGGFAIGFAGVWAAPANAPSA